MRFKTILALLLLALLLAGCSAGSKDALPDTLLETSYTYPDEWPENRFTDCIPQPDGCTVESVRDLSSVGRYELKDRVYYRFGRNRTEQAAREYRERLLREADGKAEP